MANSTGSSNLKKAIIHVLDASGNKKKRGSSQFLSIRVYPGEEQRVCQHKYSQGSNHQYSSSPEAVLEPLSMDLFFDSYEEDRDVRDYTDKVTDLLKIDPELHAPPVLKFIWGNLNFTCVLTKASKKFTMFRQDGIPVRATLNVSFSQFMTESDLKASPLHSPDKTKAYTIKQGDNLWGIAAKMYGDPAFWRPIADENGIDNPRILEAGKDNRHTASGEMSEARRRNGMR